MAYKIKPPYKEDNMNIPVYRRNLDDGSIGKSNHTGIIVQGGLDKETEKAVVAHETVHQHQQRNGELDYDENNFYWKGKTYPRENLNEHNENLPWEKEAYEKSNDMLNKDNKMKKGFKLSGYRGNKTNKFSELSNRGLIGPQHGSSMGPSKNGGPEKIGELKGEDKDYGMSGYTSVDFKNELGEGLQVFKPEDRSIDAKRKYYFTDKHGNKVEISRAKYVEKLSNKRGGAHNFTRVQHGDIVGGQS